MIGMPNELYWDSTREEVDAVFKQRLEYDKAQNRAANLRAGLVACTLVNIHSRKGARRLTPSDFVQEEKRQYMSPKEAHSFMDRWATSVNNDPAVQENTK